MLLLFWPVTICNAVYDTYILCAELSSCTLHKESNWDSPTCYLQLPQWSSQYQSKLHLQYTYVHGLEGIWRRFELCSSERVLSGVEYTGRGDVIENMEPTVVDAVNITRIQCSKYNFFSCGQLELSEICIQYHCLLQINNIRPWLWPATIGLPATWTVGAELRHSLPYREVHYPPYKP